MFKNFIKTAFRSLLKNKGFTFLNVAGLTLGLATCLLILFYVVDELSYDKYNTNGDRIFRVNTDAKFGATGTSFAIAAPPVAAALQKDFPEVERTVRLMPEDGNRFKKGNETVLEDKVVYSDPGIFDIFTLPMIEGYPATALTAPNTAVITASTAKKYFNTTHVVGKTLSMIGDSNHLTIYTITGVIRDIPSQSHFNFDFFLSFVSGEVSQTTNFYALFPVNTYLLLKPGANYKSMQAKFPAWVKKVLSGPAYGYDDNEKSGFYYRLNLTPLTDIHLRSNRTNELGANGNFQYVYIFSAIAGFVLLIACINFMNLSTARSSNRAREVGVRKVLGSPRKYLIAQFLSESIIVTLVAALLAVAAAWTLLPLFNQLSGKELALTVSTFSWLFPCLVVMIGVVGLLAGSYPAFFLSAFQPIDVLKGKLSTGFKGGGLRSFLVVFQFSISIFLIAGTLIVYNQLRYIQKKDLGFDRNRVLIIKNVDALDHPEILKHEVKQLRGVSNATLTGFLPTGNRRWHNFGNTPDHPNSSLQTEFWMVDEDYLNTMGMQLVKGRNFSSGLSTDSSGIIVNETTARLLGYSDAPLDKKISYAYFPDRKEFHIIGVVKDFNFNSLRDNITPLAMVMDRRGSTDLGIRADAGDWPSLLARVEDKWKTLSVHQQFTYSFMDKDFETIYRTEQRMGHLSVVFTTLALIIACLGLFGLAAYAAEQRNREIGIRKILGADVTTLVALLSKDFVKLVIIAILIALPLAWWVMNKWLESFAYREGIQWWTLAAAALGALVIAFITISFQSIKAAIANPVDSLRSE